MPVFPAATRRASSTAKDIWPASSPFKGFQAPTSNTTYTPNQFFDVVIPHFSRGVVRVVAYLIRKTLGWCDADGNPQEEQIRVSYSELVSKAGISRDMIRQALDEAVAGRVIECIREGRPKLAGDAGQTALYSLCWSGAPYTTSPKEFQGFFEGEGNRTDIPNQFFDVLIPREPLSVIKVVGSVIRHSIGFQARHGRRRQQIALSYQHIQNYARMSSRPDLAKALRTSLLRRYIVRLEEGVFSHRAEERHRATYALCWCDLPIGQKTTPAPNQSENHTSIGQISKPADRSENHTSIKTKPVNKTLNGQPAADRGLLESLVALGFGEKTAVKLIGEHGTDIVGQQLNWLPGRVPAKSPAGLLRRAIEQGWPEPAKLRTTEVSGSRGWEFARNFYAAYGGNHGEPVNEPSPRDAEMAGEFVQSLLAAWPDESSISEWGRQLGQTAREQRNPFPSLQLAIRQHGDAFLVRIAKEHRLAEMEAATRDREAHKESCRASWLAWLTQREEAMRREQPDEHVRFLAHRESERSELAASRTPWAAAALASFNGETSRLHAFRQFFGLPDFWAWDAEFNNHRFNLNPTNS